MRIYAATIICFVVALATTSCGSGDTCQESSEKVEVSGERVRFTYDSNDQITAITGPGTRKSQLDYDERGRLHTIRNSDGVVRYDYNSLNLLVRLEDNTGTSRFQYNTNSQLEKMTYPQGDEIVYEYTEAGDITSVSWGDKHYLRYERDLFGNIIVMETPAGQFQYDYDYNKRIMQRKYPNGAFSQFTYGNNGRPLLIQHATPDNNLAFEFRYTYDDAGLLRTAYEWSRNGKVEVNYSYDTYSQLLLAEYSDGRVYFYEYDTFGNCVKWSNPTGVSTATYNDRDQMTSLNGQQVTYDAAGNVTRLDSVKYKYNDNDELIDDNQNRYQYNALGLRVVFEGAERETQFLHFVDDLPYVLVETGEQTLRYLWADGQVLGQIDSSEDLFFFEDHLGSIRAAMDQTGRIVGLAEFSPFGDPLCRIPGVLYGFGGEEQDITGKVFLRSRYFEPRVGRFLSVDAGFPLLTSKIINNRYAYCANSPTNYKDNTGAWPDFNRPWWNHFAWSFYAGLVQDTRYSYHFWRAKFGLPQTFPTEGRSLANANYVIGELKLHYNQYVAKMDLDVNFMTDKQRLLANRHALAQFSREHSGVPGYVGGKFNNILNTEIDGVNVDWFTSIAFMKSNMGIFRFIPSEYLYTVTKPAWIISREQDANFESLYQMFPKSNWNAVELVENIWTGKIDISSMESLNSSIPPNVGGVYLNKVAEFIGELGRIDGVVYDPVSNRVILIGEGAEGTSLPSLNIEDLAAAYRTVFGNYTTEPGVTIDPNPLNPYADSMNIIFFGGMENTHFGNTLLEADRLMKGLSLGEDNITHEKMGVDVRDYYNLLNLGFSNLGGTYNKELWSRFWLIPERIIVKVSDNKKSISFPDTRILVKTETMRWQNGQLVSAKGQVDEKAEYFASHFTIHYDEYTKQYPVYEELKNLTNLVGLMKWLKESGIHIDLSWLEKYDQPYNTPDKTPSLTVNASQQSKSGTVQTISIFGGTDLTVNNHYIEDNGMAEEYGKKALLAVAGIPGLALGEFAGSDSLLKKALALPTFQTRAPGAKMISGNELVLITRSYCSFHNDPELFGFSWEMDLPKLQISRPYRGEIKYVTLGSHKVEVQNFHLTRPFGLQDVYFKNDTVDQQNGRIVFLPTSPCTIKGLYPVGNEYHLEYFDGRTERFDSYGNIIHIDLTPIVHLKYFYDYLGRLDSVVLVEENKPLSKIKFHYDRQGRVSTAEVGEEEVCYDYDASGNLVRVLQSEVSTEYSYDKLHLVTEVRSNGELIMAMEYDEFGRLRAQRTPDSEPLLIEIRTVGNKTVITQGIGDQKTISKYDAGGRLLVMDYGSGASVRNKYHEFGSLASKEFIDQFGDKVTIEYSPDGRYTKHTNSEGHVQVFLFDEFGRLQQVQNENNALLTRKYGQTTDGWLETTESSEIQIQVVHNKTLKPVEQIITAKSRLGGQLITDLFYNDSGVMLQQVTKGLVNEKRVYKNGKLVLQNCGEQNASYSYDSKGRLHIVSTASSTIEISYDSAGLISKTELHQGNLHQTNDFQDGRLTRRTSGLGAEDTFQYNNTGILERVNRSGGCTWVIERESRRTKFIRSNVVQLEFIWDAQGRLVEMLY